MSFDLKLLLFNICESMEKLITFFYYRFSKWCRPLSLIGKERNDKNYSKNTHTVLQPYYGTDFRTLFCLLLYMQSFLRLILSINAVCDLIEDEPSG